MNKKSDSQSKQEQEITCRCYMYSSKGRSVDEIPKSVLKYLQKLRQKDPKARMSKEDIVKAVEKVMPEGTYVSVIWHDKDTTKDDAGNVVPVDKHLHIAMYLKNVKPIHVIAERLGVPVNMLQAFRKTKQFKNPKQNMFMYLIHTTNGAISEGKHRYDISEVASNWDYEAYLNACKNVAESYELEKDWVGEQILEGKLRYIDFIQKDPYTTFLLNNKTFVTTAIDARYKRMMNSPEEHKVEVIYIQGDAGSGKTAFARAWAKARYGDLCVSSSKRDSVQDYLGQNVMLFDDARPDDFEASDWLKLLDPYNRQSSTSSRYYNKYLAVKCIIVTSTVDFFDFFRYSPHKGNSDEAIDQFLRRFDTVIIAKKFIQSDIAYAGLTAYPVVPCPEYQKGYNSKGIDGKIQRECVDLNYKLGDPTKVKPFMLYTLHDHQTEVPKGKFDL